MDIGTLLSLIPIGVVVAGAFFVWKVGEWLYPPTYVQMRHGYPVPVSRQAAKEIMAEQVSQDRKSEEAA